MSRRDNIMGPAAMQLPASVFSRLSRKSFGNLVPVLTDENYFQSLLFLISISFNYCLLNNAAHSLVCHLFCQVIQNAMARSQSNVGKQ